MSNTLTLNKAYHSPVALPGQHVRIRISARYERDEHNDGQILSYPGVRLLVANKHIVGQDGDMRTCLLDATMVSHDGRVGYVVRVDGVQIRVHEQQVEVVV